MLLYDLYVRNCFPAIFDAVIATGLAFRCRLFLSVVGSEVAVVFGCFQWKRVKKRQTVINLLKSAGHVMHQQFNIQQLYVLPTLYLCVLYLSENKQRLVPLTA